MTIPRHQLAAVIANQLSAGTFDKRQRAAVAAYVLRHGATNELAPLVRDVAAANLQRGVLVVRATSAASLSATVKRDIRLTAKRLYPAARKITVTSALDSTVIGGVRLEIGEYELDLTVQHRLERFSVAALGQGAAHG